MLIFIDQYFKITNSRRMGPLRKEWQSDIVPTIGAKIESSVWKNHQKEISNVIINFDEGYYNVVVADEMIKDEEEFKELEKIYLLQKWKRLL